jgi:hypothetical protein
MNDGFEEWLSSHQRLASGGLVLCGFFARLWAASGTFLNPDEALHFQVANQTSWAAAYRASLTTAHPPLLIFVLHFWRVLGTSELWLRLPSVIAGTAFCWFLFRWMAQRFGHATGWIGLLLVTFLPPMIALSAEVRQYALLLCFMGAALYLLERAFAERSAIGMLLAYVCVSLALLTHYSALWFAAALGAYSLFRLVHGKFSSSLKMAWGVSQVVFLGLFDFLYRTHLANLNSGAEITTQEWLSNSLFHGGKQSLFVFVVGRTFGVFQFIFGQLAVGDVAGILFFVGCIYLFQGLRPVVDAQVDGTAEALPTARTVRPMDARQATPAWALAIFLLLPFALACVAAVAGVYPYGGTRHSVFLIPFAITGVSVALVGLVQQNTPRAIALALAMVLLTTAFGVPHRPYMTRADQSVANMSRAMTFLRQNLPAGSMILVDYQTSLIAGHYLCGQQPIFFDRSIPGFLVFRCSGFRVLSTGPEISIFTAPSFLNGKSWSVMQSVLGLRPGDGFWVMRAGWDIALASQLRNVSPQFHDLAVESFGKNIEIFPMLLEPGGPLIQK